MARYGKWYIGGETGSGTRGVQINSVDLCAESIVNADWFEWHGSRWIQVEEIFVQCVDDDHRIGTNDKNHERDKKSYTDES